MERRELIRIFFVTVQVKFKKQSSYRNMIMSCQDMSDIKGTNQKPKSSMQRHAHSILQHEFRSMLQHD